MALYRHDVAYHYDAIQGHCFTPLCDSVPSPRNTLLFFAFASLRLLSALAFQHFLDTVYFAFRIFDFFDVDNPEPPFAGVPPLPQPVFTAMGQPF